MRLESYAYDSDPCFRDMQSNPCQRRMKGRGTSRASGVKCILEFQRGEKGESKQRDITTVKKRDVGKDWV